MRQKSSSQPPPLQITEDLLEGLTSDAARFLFSQAEKKLVESLETDKLITDRAYRIITFLVTVLIALVSYSVGAFNKPGEITGNFVVVIALINIAIICYAGFYLIKIVFAKKLMLNGSDPRDMIRAEIVKYSDKTQDVYILLWQIRDYQIRIDYNRNQNNRRSKWLHNAIEGIIIMLLFDLLTAVIYLTALQFV